MIRAGSDLALRGVGKLTIGSDGVESEINLGRILHLNLPFDAGAISRRDIDGLFGSVAERDTLRVEAHLDSLRRAGIVVDDGGQRAFIADDVKPWRFGTHDQR